MLQWSSALLILAAGAIHLCLWFDYFRTVHVVGTLLLLNFLAGSAIALALLVRAAALVVLAAIGFGSAFQVRGVEGAATGTRGGWRAGVHMTPVSGRGLLDRITGPMARSGRPSSGRAARCR
ncbi:MAG: hypothetical protein ACXVY8_09510 [Gaiellaceae bacterium]